MHMSPLTTSAPYPATQNYAFDETFLVKNMLRDVPPASERFKSGNRPASAEGRSVGSNGDVRRPPLAPAGAARRLSTSGSGKMSQRRRITGQARNFRARAL